MKSEPLGNNTSAIEVTNISPHGFWLLWGGQEYFLAFEHFPWFRDATIGAISHIEQQGTENLHWPDLDVDLSLEIIKNPDQFSLVSKR